MSDQAQSEGVTSMDKGKGKAPEVADVSMDEDDSSEEESGGEDHGEPEGEDDDNMEEIDMGNIVGQRTRGKPGIDYAKAAQESKDLDEDDDDDDDFVDPDAGDDDDNMEE